MLCEGISMAKSEIVIHTERCKGCEICVILCPTQVLDIQDFKVNVADIEKCTACMQCELRCPDFAIEVIRL